MAIVQGAEFDGYVRAGLSDSSGEDSQVYFQLPGARTKFHLGNACEQYAELGLRQDFLALDAAFAPGNLGLPGVSP